MASTGMQAVCVPGGAGGHFESRSVRTPNELMFLKCFELLREQKLFNSRAWLASSVGPCNEEPASTRRLPWINTGNQSPGFSVCHPFSHSKLIFREMELNKRKSRRGKKKPTNLSRLKGKTKFLLPAAPSWSRERRLTAGSRKVVQAPWGHMGFRMASEGAGARWRDGHVWWQLPVHSLDFLASLKMRSTWCWLELKNPTSPACRVSDSRAPEQIVFPFPADPCEPSPEGTGLEVEAGSLLEPRCQSHPQASWQAPQVPAGSRQKSIFSHKPMSAYANRLMSPLTSVRFKKTFMEGVPVLVSCCLVSQLCLTPLWCPWTVAH